MLTAAATMATVGSVALPASPAGAAQGGPYFNNGCEYGAINANLANPSRSSASTYGSSTGCSGFKVRLYYTDAKGGTGSVSNSSFSGATAAITNGPDGSTVRYSCHQARSASAGNWSVVRQLGTGGTCPSSL
jgi:hypothetical protein